MTLFSHKFHIPSQREYFRVYCSRVCTGQSILFSGGHEEIVTFHFISFISTLKAQSGHYIRGGGQYDTINQHINAIKYNNMQSGKIGVEVIHDENKRTLTKHGFEAYSGTLSRR